MQQLTHLQKLYLEGQIQTDEEYTALQIDLEKKTLDEKLAIAGLEAHECEKLQVKMLEAQIKFNEECKKQDEKAEQERQKAAEKTAKERLSIRQKQLRIELEDAATSHYKNLTSEEDFAKEVNGIRQRYWDDLLHNYQLTEEQRTEIQKEQSEAQAEAEKEKYDKNMEMHKQYASLVTDIASPAGAGTSSATTTTNDPATLFPRYSLSLHDLCPDASGTACMNSRPSAQTSHTPSSSSLTRCRT